MSVIDSEHIEKRNLLIISASFIILIALLVLIYSIQRQLVISEIGRQLNSFIETLPSESTIAAVNQAPQYSVTIESATLSRPGYIVIHEQKDGELGTVIGHSVLHKIGIIKNVSVGLNRPLVSGETLYAMLHTDDGNGVYDFPGADEPTKDNAGEIVVVPFNIQ